MISQGAAGIAALVSFVKGSVRETPTTDRDRREVETCDALPPNRMPSLKSNARYHEIHSQLYFMHRNGRDEKGAREKAVKAPVLGSFPTLSKSAGLSIRKVAKRVNSKA